MDCSWLSGNAGCGGGQDIQCYDWIMKVGGLPLTADYPYKMANDYCHARSTRLYAPIAGYVNITNDEQAMQDVLAHVGPASIAVNAAVCCWFIAILY